MPMCETNDMHCSEIWAVVNNCHEMAIMSVSATCCRLKT